MSAIDPHVEYYAGRTESWDWFGTERWWEKWLVWIGGWDGCGQYVCEIRWRWNGSSQTIRRDYVHISDNDLRQRISHHPQRGKP